MQIGTTLIQEKTSTGGSTVLFTGWIDRQADNAVFAYEQIMAEQSTLLIEVWEKNGEDVGQGVLKSGTFSADGTYSNIKYATFTGLKEMVRFRIEVKDGDWANGPCFAIYRMLKPTWFNTEKA